MAAYAPYLCFPDLRMRTWIALLRGINVGRTRSLPMKELTALIQQLGGTDVRTYIQSGNAVFRHEDARNLAAALSGAIERVHGFAPDIQMFDVEHLHAVVAANPFTEADVAPAALHVFFLARPAPAPDLAALERLRRDTERFLLTEQALYLHTPEGFGKSKLAERVENALGVPATARNWRTVSTLLEMAAAA